MTGLRRAIEAARATRGLSPRPVHLRSLGGGNNATCGRGGDTFSAPIADDPAEITCKNCIKVIAMAATEGDGRCINCDAVIGHYNGCIEDPDAMCLCHLRMGDQAVTSEDDCPFHGEPKDGTNA